MSHVGRGLQDARTVRNTALLVALVGAIVYLNALGNGFALDDTHIVVENVEIHALSSLPGALASPYWPGPDGRALGLWRPVTTGLLGLVWSVSGGSPFAFHVLNLLLHATVSGLVALLLAGFMPLRAATLAGLVFAVHPVHVEAVANIVGLGEVLSAALFVGACLVYGRGSPAGDHAREPETRPPRSFHVPGPARTVVLAALYAGAVLAKEGAIVLPAVLVLLDAVRAPIDVRRFGAYLRPRLATFCVLTLTATAVLAARYLVLWRLGGPLAPPGADLLLEAPRIWTVAAMWPHYLRLLVYPVVLSADYAPDVIPVLTVWTPRAILGVGLALGTLTLALLSWRSGRGEPAVERPRAIGFAVVWFVVTVAPVSNFFFLSGVLLAERTLYLPSVGFAAAAGWLLHRLWSWRRGAALAVTALVLAPLALRTLSRTPVWASTDTVLTRLVVELPESGRAQWALGDLLDANDQVEEANAAYRVALDRLDMNYRLTVAVGGRLMNRGRERAAGYLFREALSRRPDVPNAAVLLTVLSERKGEPDDVVRWGRLAAALDPSDPVPRHLTASALESLGRYAEAAETRMEVIRLGGRESWQQWLSLGRLRLAQADTVGARAAGDSARALAPSESVRRIDSLLALPPRPG